MVVIVLRGRVWKVKMQDSRCEICLSSECLCQHLFTSTCRFYLHSFSFTCSCLSCLDLKASFLPSSSSPLPSHPPKSWHYLSSLLHIFLPVASSLPSRTRCPLIHTTEGSISSKKRRQLTVPYAVFALRCATTFLRNWIISLAAHLTSVVWRILPLHTYYSHLFELIHFAVNRNNHSDLVLFLLSQERENEILSLMNWAHSKEYLLFLTYSKASVQV